MSDSPLRLVEEQPPPQFSPQVAATSPQEQEPASIYGRQLADERQQQDRMLTRSATAALLSDPKVAGEAQRLAPQLGLPQDLIERNLPRIRDEMFRKQVEMRRAAGRDPILLRQLEDPEFAKLAQDDIDNLSTWEQFMGSFEAGQLDTESREIFDRVRTGSATPQDEERVQAIDKRLGELPQPRGFVGLTAAQFGQWSRTLPEVFRDASIYGTASAGAAAIAGQLGPQVLLPEEGLTVPAAFVTGATVGGLMSMGRQSGSLISGGFYRDATRRGMSPLTAGELAPILGLVGGALEVAGGGLFTKSARNAITEQLGKHVAEALAKPTFSKAAGKFALDYAEGMGGELGTELAQKIAEVVAEEAGGRGRLATGEGRLEIAKELGATITDTFQGLALVGSVGPAFAFQQNSARAREAQRVQGLFTAFATNASESNVQKNNPRGYEKWIAATIDAHSPSAATTYIDGPTFAEVLAQAEKAAAGKQSPTEQLRRDLPGVMEQAAAAMEAGSDVEIPTAAYAAYIAPTPLHDALMPHVRLSPDAMSAAQAEEHLNEMRGRKDAEAGMEAEAKFAEEAQTVEDDMAARITATKRIDRADVKFNAKAYRAIIETMARRSGMTPLQFEKASGLKVERGEKGQESKEAVAKEGDGKRRAEFDPATLTMRLFEKADATSFMHEGGHYFFTILSNATDDLSRSDFARFLKLVGVESPEAWTTLSAEAKTKAHERFAYGLEQYLFEGKSPSMELQPLFDRFMSWWRRVYQTIAGLNATYREQTGEDLPALSPELRGIYARMFASDVEIAQMEAVRAVLPAFQSREHFKGTDEQWQQYQDRIREEGDVARAELLASMTKDMKWLSDALGQEVAGAPKSTIARLQAEGKEARASIRTEVASAIAVERVYRLRTWLRTGRMTEEDGSTQHGERDANHKLRRADVLAMNLGGLDTQPLDFSMADGGVPVEVVAEAFGYEAGGEAMVRELLGAAGIKDAINARTDARMMAEHAEFVPGTPEQAIAVERALANEWVDRRIAEELLQMSGRATRFSRAAAKLEAAHVLSNTPLRAIQPRAFGLAAAKASQRAAEAVAAGDAAAAIAAKRQELVQKELVRQSIAARAEIKKRIDETRKLFGPDDKIAKVRNLDMVQAGRAILGAYDLATEKQARKAGDFMALVAEYDSLTFEELGPMVEAADANAQDYRGLTLDEFRDVTDTVEALWDKAKRTTEIDVDGKKVQTKQAIAELITQGEKVRGPAQARGITTDAQRRANKVAGTLAKLKIVEHWALMMDGGKPGPWTRYIFRTVRKAYDRYGAPREDVVGKLHEQFSKLDLSDAKIQADDLAPGTVFNGTAELLGAIRHAGNRSNLARLLVPYGWGTEVNGALDTSRWWAFLNRMFREGRVTKAHMDFLQSLGDIMEAQKPDAQATNRTVYGTYFEEIQAEPIVTPFGTYRGWYAPATPDMEHPGNAGLKQRHQVESLMEMGNDFRRSMPSTGRGFTIARNDMVRRPLLLDIKAVTQEVDEVLRFTYLQPAIRDVTRLIRSRELSGYLNNVDPAAIEGMLLPWLNDTAQNRMTKPSSVPALDEFLSFLRRSSGLSVMFANVTNSLQQSTGLINAHRYVQGRNLRAAFIDRLKDRAGTTETITSLSTFMDLRLNSMLGQMQEDIGLFLDPSWWKQAQAATNRHGYFLQRLVQTEVDTIVWMGRFSQEMEAMDATMDDEAAVRKAVDEADSAVRLSQGSQTPADVAAFQRSGAGWRLVTQFSGYFSVQANQVASARGWRDRTRAYAQAVALPALVSGAIAAAVTAASGGEPVKDKDGDGMTDEWMRWFFAQQAKGALAMVPVVGPMTAQALTSERRPGDRVSMAPFVAQVEAAARLLGVARGLTGLAEGDDATAQTRRDALQLLSFVTGIPVPALIARLDRMVTAK